jgi:hypothetical protein
MQQFGCVALVIYLLTSLVVGVPTAFGLWRTVEAEGAAFWSLVGGGTWATLKLTQLPRFAVTAALTPVVAKLLPEHILEALRLPTEEEPEIAGPETVKEVSE